MNIRKPADYSVLFSELDKLIAAQLPQMELYREIGRVVSSRAEKGAAVAASEHLQVTYPAAEGFSPRNLRRMRDFYRMYGDAPELLAAAMRLNWTQNVVIMEAGLTMDERCWYIRKAAESGLSKKELLRMIERAEHSEIALGESVDTCYTSREEIGNPVYPPARRKLAAHGISCDGHAARQLTNQDYDKYDLLIGMDSANLRNMYRICGGDFAGKMSLLMDHTARPGNVADPWYTEDFESTWRDVLEGCQGLLRELLQE